MTNRSEVIKELRLETKKLQESINSQLRKFSTDENVQVIIGLTEYKPAAIGDNADLSHEIRLAIIID